MYYAIWHRAIWHQAIWHQAIWHRAIWPESKPGSKHTVPLGVDLARPVFFKSVLPCL